jgi:hypothetical protein
MKSALYFCVTLLVIIIPAPATEMINPDRPLRGEWDFRLEKIWETTTAGQELLTQVTAIRTDREDKVFLFDFRHGRFFVYSSDGEYQYAFGRKGEGPGEYRMGYNFFIVEDRVIVPDMNKILVFDTRGNFLRSRASGDSLVFPRLFIDSDRFVYVPETREENHPNDQVKLMDLKTGDELLIFEIPAEEMMSVTTEAGGNQMRLNLKDSNTTPGVVITYHSGNLYLGRNDEYRIRKVDLQGREKQVFSIKDRQRKPVTPETKRRRLEGITFNGGRMPENMIQQMMKSMPDQCTHFNRLWVDKNGYVYVLISDLSDNYAQDLDIFSPEGRYLYHSTLTLPENYRIDKSTLYFTDGHLYVFAEDEGGEGRLVKYRIRPVNPAG